MDGPWQYTVFLWPVGASLIIATGLGAYAWPRRNLPGVLPLIALCAVIVVRVLGDGLVMAGTTVSQFETALFITVIATLFAPGTWLLLALEFHTGHTLQRRRWLLWLSIEPLVIAAVIVGSLLVHGTIDHTLAAIAGTEDKGGVILPVLAPTPLFMAHAAYAFVLMGAGALLFVFRAIREPRSRLAQSLLLLTAASMPVLTNAQILADVWPRMSTPTGHAISGVCIAVCIFRYRFLDILPVAREAVYNNMHIGLIAVDPDARVVDMNAAAKQLLGVTEVRVGSALPPSLSQVLATSVETVGTDASYDRSSTPSTGVPLDGVDGTKLRVEQTSLDTPDGRHIGALIEVRDVTLEVATEQARQAYTESLEQTRQELEHVAQLRSQFLANISHELRTPITLIQGPVDLLRRHDSQDLPQPARQQLDIVARNAARLGALVDELLDLSKLEGGTLGLDVQAHDLSALASRAALLYEARATERRVTLVVPDNGPLYAWCDAVQMEKVLSNLIGNALEFTDPGGEVRISISQAADTSAAPMLELRVSDTGCGIAENELERVFERFYQSDPSSTREHGGTGIGLALSRELVELHGGTLTAKSQPGEGATFILSLPCELNGVLAQSRSTVNTDSPAESGAPDPDEPTHQPAASNVPATAIGHDSDDEWHSANAAVLVVEDHADMRAHIRTALTSYRVVEAEDGAEGLALARAVIPDLIVADVMMPALDGFTLCRQLKDDPLTCHIPIVLLTARADEASQIDGWMSGADDYMTKPFASTLLAARIDNLLAQRARLQDTWLRGETSATSQAGAPDSRDAALLQQLGDMVNARMSDPELRIEDLASALAMSERQFRRKVKALTGETPVNYLRNARIAWAALALSSGARSVSEVAFAAGFNSGSYFSQCFRAQFGVSPSEYVAEHRGDHNEPDPR